VDAYRGLGAAYESLNRLEDAERTYRTAIDLRPDDWLSNGMLAAFYYRHARYGESERYFKRIIELTPDNATGYANLGGVYLTLERYVEAETALKQAIAIKPVDRTYTNLGTVYYQLGRYGEAVPIYEKAVELGGGANWVTLGNLGDCYRRLPDLKDKAPMTYRKAIAVAERLLVVNPKDTDVLKSVAFYRAVSGDKDGALRDLAAARKLAPQDTTVGFKAVLVFETVGRRRQALAALEQILIGGFAIGQVEREPDLAQLRQDPGYARIKARFPGSRTPNTGAR
jgi:tetratricopeptide (TPR) repeat protein